MQPAPANGERSALRGYRWQYDHIAALVYDALLDDDLIQVRLTDPDAGKVDDLVLVLRGGAHGYQFKSAEAASAVTLRRLLTPTATRGGPGPSLIRSIADGWRGLADRFASADVHLVSEHVASTNDQLGDPDGPRPSPEHSAAFWAQVLAPLREGSVAIADVPAEWRNALDRLRDGTGLDDGQFERLLRSLHLELGVRSPLHGASPGRRRDIITLSTAFFRQVSDATGVVELDRAGVLALVGWTGRPRLRSRHDFPVDPDTYSPLSAALAALDGHLMRHPSGYVALVGPPGAGKSTLISQALSGLAERVVRYYAYVPGAAAPRTRMSGEAMLHDLVVMLDQAGLSPARRELASEDLPGLRSQLAEQLDAAGMEHGETGRRTIVVVDGLDHVERDHPGVGSLLDELPLPGELPDGVVVLVGARTLAPVHARARQQAEERGAVVDLRDHRLTPAAIVGICRRAPVTAGLPETLHLRIADLSAGHPLALSYLLNRLRDAKGRQPEDVLADAPPYAGDVAQEYRAVWDAVEAAPRMLTVLAVVSRLRIGFTTAWLRSWAGPEAALEWTRAVRYLFRPAHDGWRFFHDSFRQFAVDRTAAGDGGFDIDADAAWHRRTADICAQSSDRAVSAEELHHRAGAAQEDTVLALAQQAAFRSQFRSLRGPDLIREDIGTALRIAAGRAEVPAMLRLLLALVENQERARALEHVDVPAALMAAGLFKGAVAYCGERARRVPLAQAYGLAVALGRQGDPSGRALFDVIDHEWTSDRESSRTSDSGQAAAVAWTAAAVRFRPLGTVLAAVVEAAKAENDDGWRRRRGTAQAMRREVVRALDEDDDGDRLRAAADAFAAEADEAASAAQARRLPSDDGQESDDDGPAVDLAGIVGAQVLVNAALMRRAAADAARQALARELAGALDGRPKHYPTALAAAELLAAAGEDDDAGRLLDRLGSQHALTASALSYNGEDFAVDLRFRYWRLQHVLAGRTGRGVPMPVPPDPTTPAGNHIDPDAPAHEDTAAIALAARIDSSVRRLAEMDARTAAGTPVSLPDAWTSLVGMFEPFRSATDRRNSSTYAGIEQQRLPLLTTVVGVAERHSPELLRLAAEHVASRIAADPEGWPAHLRASLGRRLRDAGIRADWYEPTLAEQRADADAQDVHSRLEALADLVHVHAADGDAESARGAAVEILDASFGVGYRKDYQFDEWVGWLGRALAGPEGARLVPEAGWLARLLVAAQPRTEGAPARAAARLPAEIVPADPGAAVRVFEFLVAHGTVGHTAALAQLLSALLPAAADPATVSVAADLITEILAPSSNEAHAATATAFSAAARRLLPLEQAEAVIAAAAEKVSHRALESTRASWRAGFGLPVPPALPPKTTPSDYGTLLKQDGTSIPRVDVPRLATTVQDIVALRQQEAPESTFSWRSVLTERTFTPDEIAGLAAAFADGSKESGQALAVLAEQALAADDPAQALSLARTALISCDPRGWSAGWDGGGRRRAAAILASAGGQEGRVAAAGDLAVQAADADWLAAMLLSELSDVVVALNPASEFGQTWPHVRDYLEGMAASLDLPDGDPLATRGPRWWMPSAADDPRPAPTPTTPDSAVVELAVRHLAHPTYPVRDGAVRTAARALAGGAAEAAATVVRLATAPYSPHDVLEAAGRAVLGARRLGLTGPAGAFLDEVLNASPSQVLRDLAAVPTARPRPLSPLYRLSVPPAPDDLLADGGPFLALHRDQYGLLADATGCERDSVLAVAGRYGREVLASGPSTSDVQNALSAASMRLSHPTPELWAARAAFGRVLADFHDAGHISRLPTPIARRLRTVDPKLLVAEPVARPLQVPPPPPAGHDQPIDKWTGSLDGRLREYVAAVAAGEWTLLAGTARLTVLNWEMLQEEATWATAAVPEGTAAPLGALPGLLLDDIATRQAGPLPLPGRPLGAVNDGWTLHQWAADWACLRPDLATALNWAPDPVLPGRWLNHAGEPAVERLWWVDGWWGRSERAFDDTEAEGHALIATAAGIRGLVDALGPLTTTIVVSRRKPGAAATEARADVAVDGHL